MRGAFLLTLLVALLLGLAAWDLVDRAGHGPGDGRAIEWAAFEGGYGIDFFEKVSADFMRRRPGTAVTFWGNPRMDIPIQLRLMSGEAPDAIAPAWRISPILLIGKDLVQPLDDILLDRVWPGDDRPLRDHLRADLLRWLQFESPDGRRRTYALPIDCNVSLMHYHKDLFRAHGWEPPQTWDDWRTLCRQVLAANLTADDGTRIAPIALQGRATYQMGIFDDLLHRIGGMDLYLDCYRLRPAAWQRPGVRRAAEMLQGLFDDDFFQAGCLGMTHTEAQKEFFLRHAAMIPGGAALVSEMKSVLEELAAKGQTFDLGVFPTPTVAGGLGAPGVMLAKTSLFWFIPTGARDPEGAAALMRHMLRPEQIEVLWAGPRQLISSLVDAPPMKLGPSVLEVRRALDAAPQLMPRNQGRFYPGWHRVVAGAVERLSAGNFTPEQFCAHVESAAERIRHDEGDPQGWDDLKKVGMRGAPWE